jgi:hypothetical protein
VWSRLRPGVKAQYCDRDMRNATRDGYRVDMRDISAPRVVEMHQADPKTRLRLRTVPERMIARRAISTRTMLRSWLCANLMT